MQFSLFAQRFQQETGTVQLMDDLGKARWAKPPVYMLGGGNPAHIPEVETTFKAALSAILENEQDFGQMIGEYDSPQGNTLFCRSLAAMLNAEFGWPVSADNIAITNGSQSSFGLLFNALAGYFDDGYFKKILLPITPEYVGYADVGLADQNIFEGRRPAIERIGERAFKYRVDFERLVINPHRHGAVCVSRRTNPTGNVISDEELDELRNRCRDAGVPLIIDSAYGLPFPGIVFTDAKPRWDEGIILCLSLSKLGLPGLRTGIVVASSDVTRLIRNANAINSLAPGRVGPTLATALLKRGDLMRLCKEAILPHYQSKVNHALSMVNWFMRDLPVRVHCAEGAIFLWLWFERLPITSGELYQRLVHKGVYILPGHHFFPGLNDDWRHRHECIRVNYAAADDIVETGLQLIADTVREAYSQR